MRIPDPDQELVICVSGGKDSSALALWLRYEAGLPNKLHLLFNDTGHEHPFTLAHVQALADHCGLPLNVARCEKTFIELCESKKMFPSRLARFCTEELKIIPSSRWLDEAYGDGRIDNPVLVMGVRADESPGRAKMPEWDSNDKGMKGRRKVFDCPVWRPILRWGVDQVFETHRRHGLEPNPLYKMGVARVGCFPCVFSGKADLRASFLADPELLDRLISYEERVTRAASNGGSRSCLATFKHYRDIPPAFWDGEADDRKDPSKKHPRATIRAFHRWAMGDPDQGQLFDEPGEGSACWSHYGLCE